MDKELGIRLWDKTLEQKFEDKYMNNFQVLRDENQG